MKFLCCIDLKPGALIIGYLTMIIVAAYELLLLESLVSASDFVRKTSVNATEDGETTEGITTPVEPEVSIFLVVAVVTCLAIVIVFCVFSIRFIQGIKQRNQSKIRQFKTFLLIGAFAVFVHGFILGFHWINGFVVLLVLLYFFVVVRSFEQEEYDDDRKGTQQDASAPIQVVPEQEP